MDGKLEWEHNGIIAVGNGHEAKVKLTFPQAPNWKTAIGSPTPAWAAGPGVLSIYGAETLDGAAFRALILEAADYNAKSRSDRVGGYHG